MFTTFFGLTRRHNGLQYVVLLVACMSYDMITHSAAAETTSTTGTCSPIAVNKGGITSIEVKCPTQVLSNVTYQLDDATANALAAHFALSNEAIINFFKKLNDENVPPYELAQRLNSLVVEVKRLRAQLATISVNPNSQAIWNQAVSALEQGRIDDAIALHLDLVKLSTKNVQAAFATLVDAVRVQRSLGDLYMLTYRYDDAAEIYRSAVLLLPTQFAVEIARLKTDYADAVLLGTGKLDQVLSSSQEALLATKSIEDTDPETRLKALGIALRVLISRQRASDAMGLFKTSIDPLLKKPELAGSSWATFCISCAGSALIKLEDYQGAITLLEAGLEFSNKQIAPDKVALAGIYFNLSHAYRQANKADQAPVALQKAKTLLTEAFPDERHPDLVQIYLELANRTDETEEQEKAILRAFELNAGIFPYTQDTYEQTLKDVLEKRSFRLPIPGNVTIGTELSSDTISKLYDIHMANVKRFSKDLEPQAEASNHFAFLLAENDRSDEAVESFQKTVSLYPEASIGRSAGVARYNIGRFMFYRGGDDTNIELNFKEALRNYNQALGNMSTESSDVRGSLIQFYVSRSRKKDAEKVIADFVSSVSIKPTPSEVRSHVDALRKLLIVKKKSK